MTIELPEELKAQMGDGNPDRGYSKHDFVLSYINKNREVTVDELLVYLWLTHDKTVTARSYLHSILKRLRDQGLIKSTQFAKGKSSTYTITTSGESAARPFIPGVSHE